MPEPDHSNPTQPARVLADASPSAVEALAWLAGLEEEGRDDRLAQPYVDAAAVLSHFDPGSIAPAEKVTDEDRPDALIALLERSRALIGQPVRWQLRDEVRREALQRLGDRSSMRAARKANPEPLGDPVQRGIDRLIDTSAPHGLDEMSLDDLLGLEQATAWLAGVLEDLPDARALRARIEKERLLAPMRALAGKGFHDRVEELQRLAAYVNVPRASGGVESQQGMEVIPSAGPVLSRGWPPLLIHGPGGIGKSTLLARFILEHANPDLPEPLPFVYLDFDRALLDPRRPHTLFAEAIRQIEVEFPDLAANFGSLGRDALESASGLESIEIAKSDYGRSEHLINRIAGLLWSIGERNRQPPLVVLDTFEEAEYQGESAVFVVWDMLRRLHESFAQLRVIVVGRSPLPDALVRQPIELNGFDYQTAVDFLIDRTRTSEHGPLTETDARAIVDLVGFVPLSLALAARVVLQEGLAGLRDAVGRRTLFKRIRAEQQQGVLYARILGHLHSDDPELEKLANPGLIVRRITPQVIEKVLAGPCELHLEDSGHAERLFQKLRKEVGLVDPYREPGALWHLTGVRRLMLPDLREKLGRQFTDIHQAAADYYTEYYKRHSEPMARAEEIYHRLCLRETRPTLEALWTSGVESWLRSAVQDLEPQGRIWLSAKLGIDVDAELRAQADLADWEKHAERQVRTLVSSGLFDRALDTLRERQERTPGSPLYSLQVDILQLRGAFDEARNVAEAGLASADTAGNRSMVGEMLSRLSTIDEREGLLEGAARFAGEALDAVRELGDPLPELSALVALLRLERKAAQPGAEQADDLPFRLRDIVGEEGVSLRARAKALLDNPEVRASLRSRPALLRECAAELGAERSDLLTDAIEVLGIDPEDFLAFLEHARGNSAVLDEKQRVRLQRLDTARSSRGLGKTASALAPDFPEFFADFFAKSTDRLLRQTTASMDEKSYSMLSGYEKSKLIGVILSSFNREELALLLRDVFDIEYNNIVPPDRTFSHDVFDIIQHFEINGIIDVFLNSLLRSRPKNYELSQLITRIVERQRTKSTGDQIDK